MMDSGTKTFNEMETEALAKKLLGVHSRVEYSNYFLASSKTWVYMFYAWKGDVIKAVGKSWNDLAAELTLKFSVN